MIYELRIYTCVPGTVEIVLEMWESQGQAMIEPHMKMVGQWVSQSGKAHQIFTVWEFRDLNHRQQAREDLLNHPGFAEYLKVARQYYVEQEAIFLSPTKLSPIK